MGAQYEIRHDCERLHCAIDCDHTKGVWYFTYWQQTGKKFDTATKLIQYYQSYPIEHEERDSRLGKPVTPLETLRILEEEIKGAEITAKKNDLLHQLLSPMSNDQQQIEEGDKVLVGLEGAKPAPELLDKLKLMATQGRQYTAIANHCRRIKGVCELSREIGANQRRSKLSCNISHSWFWKVTRRQVEKIFNDETVKQGSFCIRPRRDKQGVLDQDAPYALSYVNEENRTDHMHVYWSDINGYTLCHLDSGDAEEPFPRLGYFVEQHLRPGSVRYDVDDDVSIKKQIRLCKCGKHPLLVKRELDIKYLYSLFEKTL